MFVNIQLVSLAKTDPGFWGEEGGEVENSENSETSENQFSEVFNSEFSVLCYTQNRKVGVENLGDLLGVSFIKL